MIHDFTKFIELIVKMGYLTILFVYGILLCFLGLTFFWLKFIRKNVEKLLDKLDWYIDDVMRGV